MDESKVGKSARKRRTARSSAIDGFSAYDCYAPLQAALPVDHPWDSINYPLGTVWVAPTPGARWVGSCGISKDTLFPDLASWAHLYVSLSGSDATGNGSAGAPYRNIKKAIQTANASGVQTVISVSAGYYNRASLPQTTSVDVPLVFMATGGRVVVGTFDTSGVSFSPDATHTSTHSGAFSGTPARVFDTSHKDAFGNYVEMIPVASAARCNITPNSWFWAANVLYLNRHDGSAPVIGATEGASNTLALRAVLGMHFQQSTQRTLFFCGEDAQSGFDVYGGTQGALRVSFANSVAGTRVVVGADNCSFRYCGNAANAANAVSLESINGLCFFAGCDASAATADGFNFHNANAAADGMYALTLNCSARDCGRFASPSDNGHTGHEDVVGIDIAGQYGANRGGTMHWIDTSHIWAVAALAEGSRGDITQGGNFPPVEFRVGGTALMHLDLCEPNPPSSADRALLANGGGIRLRRMPNIRGAQIATGGGVITSY